MKSTLLLAQHSLARLRAMLVAVVVVLGAFQFLLTQVAAYLLKSGGFTLMPSLVPDFIQQMAGPSMLGMMSFQGIVGFGYFHPVVLASHIGLAIAIATEPAAEMETRFGDLTLARPIARHQVITRTVVLLAGVEALLLLVMTASTWTGLACCTPAGAPRPPAAMIRSLALLLAAITLCWGGLALAMASAVRRRANASGAAAVAALATFLLDYLGRIWSPARLLSALSPFHYFEPTTLIMGGGIEWREVAALIAIGAAGAAVGYAVFSRRDL